MFESTYVQVGIRFLFWDLLVLPGIDFLPHPFGSLKFNYLRFPLLSEYFFFLEIIFLDDREKLDYRATALWCLSLPPFFFLQKDDVILFSSNFVRLGPELTRAVQFISCFSEPKRTLSQVVYLHKTCLFREIHRITLGKWVKVAEARRLWLPIA